MYRNFRLNIVARVLFILVTGFLLAYVILEWQMFFAPVGLGLLLIFLTLNLVRYIERSNRDLTHLLLSIRQGAYTDTLTSGSRGKIFKELSGAMNDLVREFAAINLEKELQFQFLQAINDNINVAILSFDKNGKLLMLNPAAKKLLQLKAISSIKDLVKTDESLYKAISTIKPEERLVVRAVLGGEQINLGIQSKEMMLKNEFVKIILLQNLNHELETREIEAWQQLMRVLTHEIMNSVTPIVSLSSAAKKILAAENGNVKQTAELSQDNLDDTFESVNVISSRSSGLLRFVTSYKEYSKPIPLKLEKTDLAEIIKRVVNLMNADLRERKISLTQNVSTDLSINADAALLEQVFINLIKNAMDAVQHDGTGRITIDARRNAAEKIAITIIDNGHGMDDETLSNIFIPFFTTKANGSGIGLSLSRQITKLHGGNLTVTSQPGTGSSFRIEL